MPQAADADLAAERRKLELIADSLAAQEGAERRWLAAAWQRLYDRADALAVRERAIYGSSREATVAMLDRIDSVLEDLDPGWERSLTADAHHRRRDRWSGWAHYGGAIVDDDYDEWDHGPIVPDDPNAPPAPQPFAVIPPNSSPRNRYGGGRPNPPGDSVALEWMFGEGKLSRQPPVVQAVRTGAPAGRPRRGTNDRVIAVKRLLDLCPGRTIEELRGCRKLSGNTLDIRSELATAITQILDAKSATAQALAEALERSKKAVYRLRDAVSKRAA